MTEIPAAKTVGHCPLPECNRNSEQSEVTSIQEHYFTEQHQKNIATSMCKLFDKISQNSEDSDAMNDEDRRVSGFYEGLNQCVDLIEKTEQVIHQKSLDLLKLQNQWQNISEEVNKRIQMSVEEANLIKSFSMNQQILEVDTHCIEESIKDLSQTRRRQSSDGSIVWKIKDVQSKMRDAQSERQTSVYSSPFYTSATGYKLCARLYLNGDGAARGTHASIFIVILRGEYDAQLVWPFSQKVSFCLYDQRALLKPGNGEPGKDIIESFRPDIKSISFERPSSSINIASGIPKFCSLDYLTEPPERNRYIVDDTMIIKVFVDFIGLPRSMVPFVFKLNCALPFSVQRKLIDEEMKRRGEKYVT